MSYINNDMKLAAHKIDRGDGNFDYMITIYRGNKPTRVDPRKYNFGFAHIEFTISITSDTPLAESLERLGVNTEYPIDITGFESSGDKILKDAQRFSLGVNQAEVRTKDGSFESQYFECPRCNCPATPIVEVQLKIQDVDKFNSGDKVEVESGKVSFHCPNRECKYTGSMTYRDLILHKTIAGNKLQFFKGVRTEGQQGEPEGRLHFMDILGQLENMDIQPDRDDRDEPEDVEGPAF